MNTNYLVEPVKLIVSTTPYSDRRHDEWEMTCSLNNLILVYHKAIYDSGLFIRHETFHYDPVSTKDEDSTITNIITRHEMSLGAGLENAMYLLFIKYFVLTKRIYKDFPEICDWYEKNWPLSTVQRLWRIIEKGIVPRMEAHRIQLLVTQKIKDAGRDILCLEKALEIEPEKK